MELESIPEYRRAVGQQQSAVGRAQAGEACDWEQRSPIDHSLIQTVTLLDREELDALAAPDCSNAGDRSGRTSSFLPAPVRRTSGVCAAAGRGYAARDGICARRLPGDDGRQFAVTSRISWRPSPVQKSLRTDPITYEAPSVTRQIRCAAAPWGTVAVVLPQNAFLLVALTCLLNALLRRKPGHPPRASAVGAVGGASGCRHRTGQASRRDSQCRADTGERVHGGAVPLRRPLPDSLHGQFRPCAQHHGAGVPAWKRDSD